MILSTSLAPTLTLHSVIRARSAEPSSSLSAALVPPYVRDKALHVGVAGRAETWPGVAECAVVVHDWAGRGEAWRAG